MDDWLNRIQSVSADRCIGFSIPVPGIAALVPGACVDCRHCPGDRSLFVSPWPCYPDQCSRQVDAEAGITLLAGPLTQWIGDVVK